MRFLMKSFFHSPTDCDAASLPFFEETVAAGFPSPAAGDINQSLNLMDLCVKHPQATFFIRARGESMIGAGISDGDVLVVDRALQARHGDIVIASVHGEFTVKRLEMIDGRVRLLPENSLFAPIEITPDLGAEFFGVVSSVVKLLR